MAKNRETYPTISQYMREAVLRLRSECRKADAAEDAGCQMSPELVAKREADRVLLASWTRALSAAIDASGLDDVTASLARMYYCHSVSLGGIADAAGMSRSHAQYLLLSSGLPSRLDDVLRMSLSREQIENMPLDPSA